MWLVSRILVIRRLPGWQSRNSGTRAGWQVSAAVLATVLCEKLYDVGLGVFLVCPLLSCSGARELKPGSACSKQGPGSGLKLYVAYALVWKSHWHGGESRVEMRGVQIRVCLVWHQWPVISSTTLQVSLAALRARLAACTWATWPVQFVAKVTPWVTAHFDLRRSQAFVLSARMQRMPGVTRLFLQADAVTGCSVVIAAASRLT